MKFGWFGTAIAATAFIALAPGVAGAATSGPQPSATAESADYCPWKTRWSAPVYQRSDLSSPVVETLPPGFVFTAARNISRPFRLYAGHGYVSTNDIVISGRCFS